MIRFAAIIIALTALVTFSGPPAVAATQPPPPTIAVLPFALIGPQERAYLIEGVRVMLSSRLGAGPGPRAVLRDRGLVAAELALGRPSTSAEFLALGKRLEVDHLVSGVLTSVGGALSLDLQVFNIAEGGAARDFFASAATEDEVITVVNELAGEIRAAILDPARAAAEPRPVITPQPPHQPLHQPPLEALTRQPAYISPHPMRQFHAGWGPGASPLIRPADIHRLRGYTKSHDILLGLHAMDVADITGDGQQEFILAGSNQVEVYRRELGRFIRIARIDTLNRYPIHFVSTADFNGNGRAEIYISAADNRGPNALVLEWDGRELARIHDRLDWYIRVMELPMEGKTLVGQRAGVGLGNFLLPGIFRLHLSATGAIEPGAPLNLPGRINLFDFVYVDLDGDGIYEIVAITQSDRLEVMNAGGGRMWLSDGFYGGTTRYLGGQDPLTGETGVPVYAAARYFVPSRIIVRDVDQDGRPNIVVTKNHHAFSRLFRDFRSFSGGEINALAWDGAGMSEVWRTRKIAGYIADIQLGPDLTEITKDGETIKGAELFVGVVLRSDGLNILAASESAIYIYPVEYLPTSALP